MDQEQLRALRAVVDEGTFDAAARALHITPSAVSQRIKSLETSVGRVLVRRTKPTEVTESGSTLLRLARQMDSLTEETLRELRSEDAHASISLAVNADSLATWVLPALAHLAPTVAFDIHREDQDHTAELLRDGTVTAAITSDGVAVRGCTVRSLGAMRYRPTANVAFCARWFSTSVDDSSLAAAPVVVFDRKDRLQERHLLARGVDPSTPPRHVVPASAEFLTAVRLGFGWGMIPDLQRRDGDGLVAFDGDAVDDVGLYWQQWALSSTTLDRLADAFAVAAQKELIVE
ncbi:transcriptional regulator ArgP [Rhodococcoides trifolii]|uniref:HTH-type transcriptional regulator LysG n=1 Tax=Rhodococcoides trifolii TaxID=908250 RepID=A0A917G533_9NOCA|nr:LysR family transcriptional regulator ArgP [Rhodococcus trifolii]GGG23491.1 transcriptional regulator ArgP [Rhodococcus trifolii]